MKQPCRHLAGFLTLSVLACLPAGAVGQQPVVAGGFQVLGRPPGKVETQDMTPFPLGKWQNDDQLWWTGARPGDKLNLVLPIKDEGTYRLNVVLTKAVRPVLPRRREGRRPYRPVQSPGHRHQSAAPGHAPPDHWQPQVDGRDCGR
jgi:hypothetical protein